MVSRRKVTVLKMKSFSQSSFSRFFTRFHKIFLASLLFTLPFAFFTGLFVLIAYLTNLNNIIVWGLGIIPSFPFYAGLVMVIRKYAIEKVDCDVIKVFFASVKENFKKFLVHGVATYAVVACTLFALLYYGVMAQTDMVYGSIFTLYIMFSVLLLAMMFYVPIMTVTYELRLRDIYKNSFLLVFGKILRTLIALVLVAIVSVAAFLAIIFSEGAMLAVTVALTVILYPLITSYIIISVISKGLQDAVGSFTDIPQTTVSDEEEKALEQKAIENASSNDDYVFVNGRMVKNTHHKNDE